MGVLVIICVLVLVASWCLAFVQNKRMKKLADQEKAKEISRVLRNYEQDLVDQVVWFDDNNSEK